MKRGTSRDAKRKPRTGRFEGGSYPESKFRFPIVERILRILRRLVKRFFGMS